jgi:hypothetical protein
MFVEVLHLMPTRIIRQLQRATRSAALRQDRFWRDLPPWALPTILLAVFFTFSSLGFLTDVVASASGQPFFSAIYHALLGGSCAAASAWIAMKRVRWAPVVVLVQVALIFPLRTLVNQATSGWFAELALQTRFLLDVLGSIAGLTLGYALFIVFVVRAGGRLANVHAELRVARVIHETLVPPIARTVGRFEFCGNAQSSGQVGGDLVDVIPLASGRWIAYVADVAGHGIPSALLTGMVKSAMRVRLLTQGSLAEVVSDLNRLVCENVASHVFVTLVAMQGSDGDTLDCVVAGHPPIVHLVSGTDAVAEIAASNPALGIDPEWHFEAQSLRCGPGDLLAIVTDGLLEIFNRKDEEFGLGGLKHVLVRCQRDALPVIRDRVQAAAQQHGPQLDDQTILLVRYSAIA